MKFGSAKVIFFDFDGTLVDSNRIKWAAFERCFSGFPERFEEIMEYCRGNNHTTRLEKFRWVYERILRLPYTPELEGRLSRQFEESTTEQIIRAPEIPGAEEFLRDQAAFRTLGLLSSTPHDILLRILSGRGWSGYFRVVRGAPVDKRVFLRSYLQESGLRPEEVFFFGDTPEDREAARGAGWPFVAVRPPQDWEGVPRIADYREGLPHA